MGDAGGFVRLSENLDEAAKRVCTKKQSKRRISWTTSYLRRPDDIPKIKGYHQLVILLLLEPMILNLAYDESLNIKDINWHKVNKLPALAFDHDKIIAHALKKIKKQIGNPLLFVQLLAKKFTLTEIQQTYETILGKKLINVI